MGSGSRRPSARRTLDDLGEGDEGEVVAAPRGGRGSWSGPADAARRPGHIRVTYGTRAENRRLLEAMRELG